MRTADVPEVVLGLAPEMASRLVRVKQIEAVGILAGGLVHDFNNELTIIRGYAEMLQQILVEDSDLAGPARQIVRAADRCAVLVRRVLGLCRRQKSEIQAIDVNGVVGDMARPLACVLGEKIALSVTPRAAPSHVAADRGLLESAILNLALNARDAMVDGGRLVLETRTVRWDKCCTGPPHVPAGSYVLLTVADTGTGIDPEIRQRIFDPFFTTKPEGTGLGLPMVQNFVDEAGGFVAVQSEPSHGTLFKVYLPCLQQAVRAQETAAGAPASVS
jgi:signal transduction histidine kinase